MQLLDQVLMLLDKYGPAITAVVVMYMHNRVVEQRNKTRLAELKAKLLQNGIDVEKENAGLSPGAIINKYAKGKGP